MGGGGGGGGRGEKLFNVFKQTCSFLEQVYLYLRETKFCIKMISVAFLSFSQNRDPNSLTLVIQMKLKNNKGLESTDN